MSKISVALVDGQPLALHGMAAALLSESELVEHGRWTDLPAAIKAWIDAPPSVAVIDTCSLGADPVTFLTGIRGAVMTRSLVRVPHAGVDIVHILLNAGAHGIVEQCCEPEELVRAIRAVGNGERYVPPEIREALHDRLYSGTTPGYLKLTSRERQIVALIASGMAASQVAAQLIIEVTTVRSHLRQAYAKLGARDRADAFVLLLRLGLINIDQLETTRRVVSVA